jgi:CHAT domain-containing protein
MEFPRLMGSRREVENCANIWRANGYPSIVLDGAAATRQNLAQALHNNPSVLHMATHILFPPSEASLGLVALSLQAGNQVEFLSATETASMRAKLGLVVLDGCSSGHGAILPGAGLMGLTRAWLVAGARAVISTRWPADDQESGGLFVSLYRLYFLQRARHPLSFGTLLQEAQLEELLAGGRRADPAHWASYFCVERN